MKSSSGYVGFSFLLCVLTAHAQFTRSGGAGAVNKGDSLVPRNVANLTVKFSTINVPGALQTIPGGISNAGVTVGQYEDSSGAYHGYILDAGNLTTLDVPSGSDTVANNITATGTIQVVGSYTNSSNNSEGFLYKDGSYTNVPGPSGSTSSSAVGINDYAVIVGYYTDASNVTHGFMLTGSGYTTLDAPGATATFASGINDKSIIVLFWLDSSGAYESSMYDSKTEEYESINVPGASSSFASDIDNAGDVTYQWLDSAGGSHGAVLHAGTYYKFNYPSSVYTYVGGINNDGAAVGGYRTVSAGPMSGFEAKSK
jgi:hypothetical protein